MARPVHSVRWIGVIFGILTVDVLLSACGSSTSPKGTLIGQIRSLGSGHGATKMIDHLAGTVTVYRGMLHNVSVPGQPDSLKPTPTGPKVAVQQVRQGGSYNIALSTGTYVMIGVVPPDDNAWWTGPFHVAAGRATTENVTFDPK
jgi:hypothetical protein